MSLPPEKVSLTTLVHHLYYCYQYARWLAGWLYTGSSERSLYLYRSPEIEPLGEKTRAILLTMAREKETRQSLVSRVVDEVQRSWLNVNRDIIGRDELGRAALAAPCGRFGNLAL